jgi:hypothetical protein
MTSHEEGRLRFRGLHCGHAARDDARGAIGVFWDIVIFLTIEKFVPVQTRQRLTLIIIVSHSAQKTKSQL